MKDLKLGAKVLTAKNTYQPVYSFGHRKTETEIEFYQIYSEGMSAPLELTGNHMIMVADGRRTKAIRADRLQVGDKLLHVEGEQEVSVTEIKTIQKRGLYMPLTTNGQIVVNHVLASNYISISDEAPGIVAHSNWFFTFLSMPEQKLSHWWLSPFRMLCMGVSSGYCSNGDEILTANAKNEEDQGILPWLLTGRKLAELAELQPGFVQMIVFGFPAFVVFGAFNLVETLFFGPAVAPSLIAFLFVCFVYAKVLKKEEGRNEENDLGEKLLDA
jgi:Hint module